MIFASSFGRPSYAQKLCRVTGMVGGVILLLLITACPAAAQDDEADPRSFMHGIGAVPDGKNGYWVFFSSSGLPPRGEGADEEWLHNIYIGEWNGDGKLSDVRKFIKKPPPQEPVSVAQTDDGHIMVLSEDGWDSENEVDERYAVYDQNLKTIQTYYQTAADGGHSGHVAASGNLFAVTYSEGWVDGGGVNNLGSGHGVYAKIYDSNGNEKHSIPLAARKREWWPLIAASPDHAIVVWQEFIKGQSYARLKYALINPQSGKVESVQIIYDGVQYYTYAVQSVADEGFLVAGTAKNGYGFAFLIGGDGKIYSKIDCMPPIEREAGIAVRENDAFIPSADNRLLRLKVTKDSLALTGVVASPIHWSSVGSIGLPNRQKGLHWFSLNKSGLQEADFDVTTMLTPTPQDSCSDK